MIGLYRSKHSTIKVAKNRDGISLFENVGYERLVKFHLDKDDLVLCLKFNLYYHFKSGHFFTFVFHNQLEKIK